MLPLFGDIEQVQLKMKEETNKTAEEIIAELNLDKKGLPVSEQLDGQRESAKNTKGSSKSKQVRSGNSGSESGVRPQCDVIQNEVKPIIEVY